MLLGALLAPLFGFLVLMSLPLTRKVTGFVACTAVFVSFAGFCTLFYMNEEGQLPLYSWIELPGLKAVFSLHLDHLSHLMALIITGVGFLIHVYSNGYMEHESAFRRYFACMNFFIFAMLLLVLAGDLALLFIGWEGVGLASYLLIGFYLERPQAAAAATKAFVVNRIGDFGLLLGILLTFALLGTSDIAEINRSLNMPWIALLFFLGAIGKSAQLPLSTWLPDAMEGPTPVSALIHAATMVTAGVYLVVRFHPLFLLAPDVLNIVGTVGAITALWAAMAAVAQMDLKRVLAYSTVSQLGLMFVACGAGAFYSAMFHLTTHAFIKGLLFLSAGNVVHMAGTTDMSHMGGLRKSMPYTHVLFLIGVLAMSGIPPFAAFFSKDLILEQEIMSGHTLLFVVSFIACVLTSFYLVRAYLLTFFGTGPKAKEAPWIMRLPASLLAVLAAVGGVLGLVLEAFLKQIRLTPAEEELDSGFVLTLDTGVAVAGALMGVLGAILLRKHLLVSWAFLREAFYLDAIYEACVIYPLKKVGELIEGTLEPHIFEGSINFAASSAQKTGAVLSLVQSGQIRAYVAWITFGAALLLGYFML